MQNEFVVALVKVNGGHDCCISQSGLCLLSGVIVFMGNVTGESSHQVTATKDKPAVFQYRYGLSFIGLIISFCLIEVAGIMAVYLFIIRWVPPPPPPANGS